MPPAAHFKVQCTKYGTGDGGRPSAEENPADLLPHVNWKRTGTGMAEGPAGRGKASPRSRLYTRRLRASSATVFGCCDRDAVADRAGGARRESSATLCKRGSVDFGWLPSTDSNHDSRVHPGVLILAGTTLQTRILERGCAKRPRNGLRGRPRRRQEPTHR